MTTTPAWWEYAVAFAGCAGLATVLTPLALEVALRRGILDRPGPNKPQAEAVPYLGGVAIVVSFSAVVLASAAWRPAGADLGALAVTLGLGVVLCLVGLVDDLHDLPIVPRLVLEVAAGLVAYGAGTRAHLHGAGGPFDAVVTVLWVVGVTNAFNLLDNMDGLAAGVAAIVSLGLFGVGILNHQYFVPLLGLALVGCSVGFLRHNFFPARVYMGDAGSLFLGFVLAMLSLRLRAHPAQRVTFAVPLLLLAVPIYDTAFVVVSRLRRGSNPFIGARDHTSHRLVELGLPIHRAVAIVYAAAAVTSGLAVVASRLPRGPAFGVAGCVGFGAILVGVRLSRVPVPATRTNPQAPA